MTTLVLFRNNLRLTDNLCLHKAASLGQPVLPMFVWDDTEWHRPLGRASQWWLHHALKHLQKDLPELMLRRGETPVVLAELVAEHAITDIIYPCDYRSNLHTQQRTEALLDRDVAFHAVNDALLHSPAKHLNKQGERFQVFTPFWKAFLAQNTMPAPLGRAEGLTYVKGEGDGLTDWPLLPEQRGEPNWAHDLGWEDLWTPSEAGAMETLTHFCQHNLAGYGTGRDFPAAPHVSQLSPHLRWGHVSPRQVVEKAYEAQAAFDVPEKDITKFVAEIGWREFAHHLLWHFPDMGHTSLRTEFENFPWEENPDFLKAWQRGQTGYPLVDAGARQLYETGYAHNRMRMLLGSFLVKHALHDWRAGEAWFWDTLVDACPASNVASWQWIAGCGADAAPYFRIFNPILQGEKFDPEGAFTRHFVPELKNFPKQSLWEPHTAGLLIQQAAECVIGKDYPAPMIKHKDAREKALAAYEKIKK